MSEHPISIREYCAATMIETWRCACGLHKLEIALSGPIASGCYFRTDGKQPGSEDWRVELIPTSKGNDPWAS